MRTVQREDDAADVVDDDLGRREDTSGEERSRNIRWEDAGEQAVTNMLCALLFFLF